jgi:hypothetical protein
MKSNPLLKLAWPLFTALLVLFSFLTFSAWYNAFLDEHTAVQVLMAQGFSFPGDLYFWGQRMGGSLVPWISQILCVTYKFPPALALSFVQYGILIIGYVALATFFRTYTSKILAALVWFFPPVFFTEHLTWVYGPQLGLLVTGIYFLRIRKVDAGTIMDLIWLSAACISFILSCWVSDLSFLPVLLLLFWYGWKTVRRKENASFSILLKDRSLRLRILTVSAWTILGILFITFAKLKAAKTGMYTHLVNTPSEFFGTGKIIGAGLFHILIFAGGNTLGSLFSWSVILGLPAFLLLTGRKASLKEFIRENPLSGFFLAAALLFIIAVPASRWVSLWGFSSRYFTPAFISFSIALLLYSESTGSARPVLRQMIPGIILILGAVSSAIPSYLPRVLPSRMSVLSEAGSLGYIGLFGAPEDVYPIGASVTDKIKVAPREGEFLRNFELVKRAITREKIYFTGRDRVSSFPDTIRQYGRIYARKGNSVFKGECFFCRYERVIRSWTFGTDTLHHQGNLTDDPVAPSGKAASTGPGMDRKKHFIYGPFVRMKAGSYIVQYCLKVPSDVSTDPLALLDVSADFGKKIVATRLIRASDFGRNYNYEYFQLPFTLEKDMEGLEFRILYEGNTPLFFDHLVVREE